MKTSISCFLKLAKKLGTLAASQFQVTSLFRHSCLQGIHNSVSAYCTCKLCHFVGLLQLITRSSMPNPVSALLSSVYDFKKWMEPYLGALKGHSKYHVFRFTLNAETKKAEMHYKQFSKNPWEPVGAGVSVISVSFGSLAYCLCTVLTCCL